MDLDWKYNCGYICHTVLSSYHSNLSCAATDDVNPLVGY